MEKIITDIYEIMKHSSNPIEIEEKIQSYMWDTFSEIMGEILGKINQTIKEVCVKFFSVQLFPHDLGHSIFVHLYLILYNHSYRAA